MDPKRYLRYSTLQLRGSLLRTPGAECKPYTCTSCNERLTPHDQLYYKFILTSRIVCRTPYQTANTSNCATEIPR